MKNTSTQAHNINVSITHHQNQIDAINQSIDDNYFILDNANSLAQKEKLYWLIETAQKSRREHQEIINHLTVQL